MGLPPLAGAVADAPAGKRTLREARREAREYGASLFVTGGWWRVCRGGYCD